MTRSNVLGRSHHGRFLNAIASKDARLAQTDVANTAVGYLSIVEHKSDGLFGGYLIVTPTGRPVEFHCTTPLVANRAQEILYGASLRPYLCGELISQQLLRQASRQAAVVLVDTPEMLVAESFTQIPVVRIGSVGDRDDAERVEFQVAPSCQEFSVGRGELAGVPAASSSSTSVLDMSRSGKMTKTSTGSPGWTAVAITWHSARERLTTGRTPC